MPIVINKIPPINLDSLPYFVEKPVNSNDIIAMLKTIMSSNIKKITYKIMYK